MLIAAPKQTLPWLQEHSQGPSADDSQRIARLVAELDSDQFATRQRAARELEKLADLAEPALRKALAEKPSAEVRRQAEGLLVKLDGPVRSPEVLRGLRAIELLEYIGTSEARQQLERQAREALGGRVQKEAKAALERLAKQTGRQ
jgi:hypothetical protein